jgi:hypothetical protein
VQRPGHHDQVPAAHNQRRRGQRPGAAIKYLRCTTSAARCNGLDTTIKYLQRTTSGAAGSGRAQRSSTCDAQLAPPLGATAWTPRPSSCNAQRGRRGQRLGAAIQFLVRITSGAAGNGLSSTIKYLRRTTRAAAGNGRAQRPNTCNAQPAAPQATALTPRFKYLQRTTRGAAGNGRAQR